MLGYLKKTHYSYFWQEYQNFFKPFFDFIFRQHSSMPIFTGFFEPQTGILNQECIHRSAEPVENPVRLYPTLAFWYDEISCKHWDQSTLEPLKVRTERVGILVIAVIKF